MSAARPRPTRVLVVCHGNLYRSPLAASVLATAGNLEVRSAGFTKAGRRAAKRMRLAAASLGHDLEQHRSAVVDAECLSWADLVIYMDSGNRKRLVDAMRYHGVRRPYACLGSYCIPPRRSIRDPAFVRDREEFTRLACDIDRASRLLAASLAGRPRMRLLVLKPEPE